MYLIKHAIANLGRNKGRNVILGGMLLLVLFSSTTAIMIYHAAGDQIRSYKKQFSAFVILYRDNEKLQQTQSYTEPSWKDLEKYATSKLLKSVKFIGSAPVSLENAKALDESSSDVSGFDRESLSGVQTSKPSTNMLFATDQKEINDEFKNGIRKLVQGRVFENKNEIIVSQQLAELNCWKLHDEIVLRFPNPGKDAKTVNMKLVGIYEDHVAAYENKDLKMPLVNRGNEIMTSLQTLRAVQTPLISITANYRIKDPARIKELETEFHEMGLPAYFALKTDTAMYQKLIAPLESLQNMAGIFLILVLVVGSCVLVVISMLAIRERMYEIGVLRAIGMKKHILVAGLLMEICILTAITLSLSFAGAKAASGPIAAQLFQEQKQQSSKLPDASEATAYSAIGGFQDNSGTVTKTLQTEITGILVLEVGTAAFLFAIISSAGGIYYAMRLEPRRILSERN